MPGALGTATTDLLPQLEVLTAIIVGLDIFNSCLSVISSRASVFQLLPQYDFLKGLLFSTLASV